MPPASNRIFQKTARIAEIALFLAAILPGTNARAVDAREYLYEVQPGDDLGTILYSIGHGQLWGNKGRVKQTVFKNADVIKNNGDLLIPGQRVRVVLDQDHLCNVQIEGLEIKITHRVRSNTEYSKIASLAACRCEPERAPASIGEVMTPAQSREAFGRIRFTPVMGFSKISGTDSVNNSTAEILSKTNFGANLAWEQHWNKNFESAFILSFEKTSLESTGTRTFQNQNQSLFKVGAGGTWTFENSVFVEGKALYGQQQYLYAPDQNTLRMDRGNTLETQLGIGSTLVEIAPFALMIEVGGRAILGSSVESYTSKTGLGYFGELTLQQKLDGKSLFGKVTYESQNKNTSAINQDHKNIRFSLGFSWDFGK